MKRIMMTIVAAWMMITSMNAQRLTNIQAEARFITDKMVVELGLSKAQRNNLLNINFTYLDGIRSYRDIDAYGWHYRNKQLKRMMTARQWKRFKNSYYFYRVQLRKTGMARRNSCNLWTRKARQASQARQEVEA